VKGSLDLELTRRCNLRCDYCFVGWSRDWHSDMPSDIARSIVEEGAGLYPMLHITGGEPFAYRPLFSIVDAALTHGYEEILINTNGTLLSASTIEELASRGDKLGISVSLDGPEPLHDSARGKGRFHEARRGLEAALAAGVRASVMTVVTPEVLGELVPFLDDLAESFPTLAGVTLFPVGVGPAGSQKPGATLRPLTTSELRELCLTVALLFKAGHRVGIGAYPMVNPLLRALGYPEALLYQCTAGRGRVCVHADLTVSSCHPVKEAIYGRYRPGLLRKLGEVAAHRILAERNFEGCASCEHQSACGHCRAFVVSSGEPLFGNDGVCHELYPNRPLAKRRVRLPVVAG